MPQSIRIATLLLAFVLPSASSAEGCIWYADVHAIHQFDTSANQVTKTVLLKDPQTLAMVGKDCGVWAVGDDKLYHFDSTGVQTQKIELRSVSKSFGKVQQTIADPYDGSVWLSDERRIFHLNANGGVIRTWDLPGKLRSVALAVDQSVWMLGNKELWHYSPQGVLLQSLNFKGVVDSEPKFVVIDDLRNTLWIAGEKKVTQIKLNQTAQSTASMSVPDSVSALALNPLSGELWLATKDFLRSYGADGQPVQTVKLMPGPQKVEILAFDSVTQELWAGRERSINRFTAQGQLVAAIPTDERVRAVAVMGFVLRPSLLLVRPSQDAISKNSLPEISYSFDALCNGRPCGFSPDYFRNYELSVVLNNNTIHPFKYDKNLGQSVYEPSDRLPEGRNTLAAQVRDGFGHTSAIVTNNFTIDTVAPRFLGLTPADGSVLPKADIMLEGIVDDPTAAVILEGVAQVTNTSVIGSTLAFNFPLTLKPGPNTFKLSAVDTATNSTSRTLNLTYQPQVLLALHLLSPTNGAVVRDRMVLVSGTLDGPANTGITINGVVAVQDGSRYFAQVPLELGANTLKVIATTQAGPVVTQSVDVIREGSSQIYVSSERLNGLAPSPISFDIHNETGNSITRIEADFDGNGVIDFVASDVSVPVTFTYSKPGPYRARFKLTDSDGSIFENELSIGIQDLTQIDQILKAQWNALNSALISNDKPLALSYLTPQAQSKYSVAFDALMPAMPTIVASYSPIIRVSNSYELGEYAVNRRINGVNRIFFVYFVRDASGVWRLDSM